MTEEIITWLVLYSGGAIAVIAAALGLFWAELTRDDED